MILNWYRLLIVMWRESSKYSWARFTELAFIEDDEDVQEAMGNDIIHNLEEMHSLSVDREDLSQYVIDLLYLQYRRDWGRHKHHKDVKILSFVFWVLHFVDNALFIGLTLGYVEPSWYPLNWLVGWERLHFFVSWIQNGPLSQPEVYMLRLLSHLPKADELLR